MDNPALQAFVALVGSELVFGQALVRRMDGGFELRHVSDRLVAAELLRTLRLEELRALAQFTGQGAYRPLRSAPNLGPGWRCQCAGEAELETALHQLYPGALGDWFAARSASPPVTHFRDFTARQTGMYRITAKLTDAEASAVIAACCHPRFCLRRRLWTTAALAVDAAADKSLIPCLEPCAVFLEFARKAKRIEQEEKMNLDLSPSELETIVEGLQIAATHPPADLREAEFNHPANPRRLQLVAEKLRPLLKPAASTNED